MPKFLVIKQPKKKYRAVLWTPVMIVEAANAKKAVETALAITVGNPEMPFVDSQDYTATKAEPVIPGKLYLL